MKRFPRVVSLSHADELVHEPSSDRLLNPGLGLDRRGRDQRVGDRPARSEREPDLDGAVRSVDLLEEGDADRRAALTLAEEELHVRIVRGEIARLADGGQVLLADADGADEVLLGARDGLPDEVGMLQQHHLGRGVGCRAQRRGGQGELDDGHDSLLAERPGSSARTVEYRTMR